MVRPLVLALFLAGLPAQEIADFERVRLAVLGPPPAHAAGVRIERDGTVAGDLEKALAGAPAAIVLEVDSRTPAAVVGAVVERCRAAGVERVLFQAVLPGRQEMGVFTLALPDTGEPGAELELRLHREGPGVPPDSMRPHLRRIAAGMAQAGKTLQLGIRVPGDSEIEPVLQVLSTAARAGASRAVVDWQRTAAQQRVEEAAPGDLRALGRAEAARPGSLALTLGPTPLLHVPAAAVPLPRPEIRERPVGILGRAEAGPAPLARGGAGGRYGGRAGGVRAVAALTDTREAIAAGLGWLSRVQDRTGAWVGTAGQPDVEATALALLAFFGDGQTLNSGPHAESIRRGVGWLMARQDADGRIGSQGDDAVRSHALATYALAEAHGLANAVVLRGHLQDAVLWLEGQRLPGGGWNDGSANAPADTLSTAWSHTALMSAVFFRLEVRADGADLASWFDEVADAGTGAHVLRPGDAAGDDLETAFTCTAAALFCRFFDGQDPKSTAIMHQAADLLRSYGTEKAALADPLRCYFTTYALYQIGGAHWAGWSKVLRGDLVTAQEDKGEDAGSWPAPDEGSSRVVTTALRILTLEAYYRYTRLVR